MAYGEVFEGTGEELAATFAALGKRRVRVTVQDALPPMKPFDWAEHERIHRRLEEITAGKPPVTKIFTAEDFYGTGEE